MFDGVFGIETTREMSDVLAHRISSKWREFEVPLMGTKWFDYRQLTAVQATYLFADRYREAFKRFLRVHVDAQRAEFIKVLKHEDLFECKPSVITGLWRARQHADAFGMPYEDYLEDALTSSFDVMREYLPQAHMLYTDRIIGYVQDRWEQRQRAKLYLAESPLYMVENYRGLPAQNSYHEWLFTQAELRANRAQILSELVYGRNLLPEEKMIARYDADLVREVQEYA